MIFYADPVIVQTTGKRVIQQETWDMLNIDSYSFEYITVEDIYHLRSALGKP